MNINTMRQNVINVYPTSKSWYQKVKGMSDAQIFAIHARFVRESKIKV